MSSALRANDGAEADAGRPSAMARLLTAVLSPRRPAPGRGLKAIALWVLRLVGAGLLVWIAGIHLRLWQEGYKFIPTNGPLFLMDAIVILLGCTALAAAATLPRIP